MEGIDIGVAFVGPPLPAPPLPVERGPTSATHHTLITATTRQTGTGPPHKQTLHTSSTPGRQLALPGRQDVQQVFQIG